MTVLLLFLTCYGLASALDNGEALTPAMGFNSWYALHSHLTYPGYEWEKGYVLADEILSIANWMKTNGYLSLGYKYINVDDCIVVGRDSNNTLIPDPQAFPHGVRNVSDTLHSMGFYFGWYTDRGTYTCSCFAGGLKRPGSLGHEQQDAQTYASWGIDYLKEDSCNANGQDFIHQYGLMRDSLNATGRHIYFNLCWGAGATIAKVGKTLGNEWRIAVDDGGGWVPIMQNVEVDSGLYMYAGPGGWNDPGLLLAGNGDNSTGLGTQKRRRNPNFPRYFASNALSGAQGRTQFNLWSILAAKLLISVDPRQFSSYTNETYTNAEVIAVDQDPLGKQGKRFTSSGNATNPGEVWGRELIDGWALLFFNNNGTKEVDIECDSACWSQMSFTSDEEVNVRDLWQHSDVGTATNGYTVKKVAPDASVLLKITKK